MEFTLDRMKHSLGVANAMYGVVRANPEAYSVSAEDAFTLGFVHDIGYRFDTDGTHHALVGGLLLKNQGYKYWREVYYHGIAQPEWESSLLWLLNYVDMGIGPDGEPMSLEDRLDDMAARFGKGSPQFRVASDMYRVLKSRFM